MPSWDKCHTPDEMVLDSRVGAVLSWSSRYSCGNPVLFVRWPISSTCETRQATRLCDYPLRGALTGTTCDKPLCASCTRSGTPKQPKTVEEMGDTYDLCPAHARMEKGTR